MPKKSVDSEWASEATAGMVLIFSVLAAGWALAELKGLLGNPAYLVRDGQAEPPPLTKGLNVDPEGLRSLKGRAVKVTTRHPAAKGEAHAA